MSLLSDKQFIFIIGSPRSGTTWLQTMIGVHPLVCTTVELTLYSNYTAPWIKAWNREVAPIEQGRWHQGLPFLWTEDEFYDFLRGFLQKVYERVVETNPMSTHILDKHPGYSEHVEDINRLLPNARFIHLIRDGRDVAVSMVAARQQIGFGTATISDSAVAWKKNVQAAQQARQYDDRYLEVRYEDLLTDGTDTLKCVFDFCKLPASPQDVAVIVDAHRFEKMKVSRITPARNIKAPHGAYRRGKFGSWREELDAMQKYLFDETAGDLLRELEYAENGWWAGSWCQTVMLPVVAATSTHRQIRKRFARATTALLGPALTAHVRCARLSLKSKLSIFGHS